MGIPTGLNYVVLFHELDRMDLSRDDYDQLFADVRVLETEARRVMHEVAEEQRKSRK